MSNIQVYPAEGYGAHIRSVSQIASVLNPLDSIYSQKARLDSLVASGPVGIHLYGNSIASAGSFVFSLCGQSGGRLFILKNSGVGGYRSDQVLSKLTSEGLHPDAKILLYIEGTNDAGQGITPTAHAANMRAIAAYAIERGVVPLLCVTPPRDTSFTTEANIMAITDQLLGLSLGIPTYDLFSRYVDASDGSWTIAAGGDGVHPSQATYGKAGVDMWDSIFSKNLATLYRGQTAVMVYG